MVSLEEQSYGNMLAHGHDTDTYGQYPEPPHSTSSYDANTSPLMYGIPTTVGFEPSMYSETSHYGFRNGNKSPLIYNDDDFRVPSSNLSTNSAASSVAASPQSNHSHQIPAVPDWTAQHLHPGIVSNEYITSTSEYSRYSAQGLEELTFDFGQATGKSFVDPSLIHPEISGPQIGVPHYDSHAHPHSHYQPHQHFPPSPSMVSSSSPQMNIRNNSASPGYLHTTPYLQSPYPNSPYASSVDQSARRPSMSSFVSPTSAEYPSGDETKEKQRCSYPDCGKVFKDLKAHMLTHQTERPEKCPIQTCEYHTKGFARKYDKNRHTLTHYKGTMVCGFCPGSGSAAEKSFNRADVFKRHLTAVHGVEQTPPNSRKKTPTGVNNGKKLVGYAPDATGKCSTCSQTFSNAQDFYEHLDDCVLRIVQQEDPAEAINAKLLTELDEDQDVKETLERNLLSTTPAGHMADEDEEADEDMEDDDNPDGSNSNTTTLPKKKGNPANGVQKSRGMTYSRGGVPLSTKSRGRKNRDKRYPPSWGYDSSKLTLKHRVMAVFDGSRRLAKDDMALSTKHEVRLKLADGKSYTTDLDIQTLRRAEGFHGATEEEKGPWISDDPTEAQYNEMTRLATGGIN